MDIDDFNKWLERINILSEEIIKSSKGRVAVYDNYGESNMHLIEMILERELIRIRRGYYD